MIQIKDLTFGYKKNFNLFNHLELQLPLGKIYGLLGKNGAGKTTLLKHITGLLYSNDGECLVFGKPSKERLPEVLNNLYLIPEEFQLPPVRMREFVKLHSPFYPRFDQRLFEKYLEEFQITDNQKLLSLSYGQKKKFLISFGLATRTQIMILDEPTNGLDIPSKSQFRKIIASSLDDEKCILISTHQVRDLSSLIDHIIILESGKVIFDKSIVEISSKLSFAQTKEMVPDGILYSEEILGGYSIIQKKRAEETEIDIELLFNGIIQNPEKINNEF